MMVTNKKQNTPKGWSITTLDRLLIETGARNKDHVDLPVLSVTNSRGFVLQSDQFARKLHSASTKNYKLISKGEFGYNPARINVGSIACLENLDSGLLSPMYVVFRTTESLAIDYFKQYVQTLGFNKQVKSNTAGSVRQSLNFSAFKNFVFLLPPKSEQKKIIEILGAVDSEIRKTEEVIASTEKLKKGLMRRLFACGITYTKFQKTPIDEVPNKWEAVSFKDVAIITNGQVDPKEEPYKSMVLIAPNHIESGSGRIIARITASDQQAISGKYLVKKGDVIYSKIRPYLQKVAIADRDCLCSADMYPIKGTDKLDNEFLFHFLLSESFTDFANSNSRRTGIPKINREEIGNYKFLLPPLDEQKKISKILSCIDNNISVDKEIKRKLILLKKGLMQDLLSGEVKLSKTL